MSSRSSWEDANCALPIWSETNDSLKDPDSCKRNIIVQLPLIYSTGRDMTLTICDLAHSNGVLSKFLSFFPISRANFLNPAPGIQCGMWRTTQKMQCNESSSKNYLQVTYGKVKIRPRIFQGHWEARSIAKSLLIGARICHLHQWPDTHMRHSW